MRNVKTILAVFCAVFTMALVAGCKGPGAIPDGNYTLVSVTTGGTTITASNTSAWSSFASFSSVTVSGDNITFMGTTSSKSTWEQAGATFTVNGNNLDIVLTSGGQTATYSYTKS